MGEGGSSEIWVGLCAILETFILFQTKTCDFPYPILDLACTDHLRTARSSLRKRLRRASLNSHDIIQNELLKR